MAKVSPAEMMQYLKGIEFPASRQDLIDIAEDNDAPEDVLEKLEQLPDKEYGHATDLMHEFGKIE